MLRSSLSFFHIQTHSSPSNTGIISFTVEKDSLYGSRHQEAVKIFNALLSQEIREDPIRLVQNILQTCFDIVDLQSEVQYVFLVAMVTRGHLQWVWLCEIGLPPAGKADLWDQCQRHRYPWCFVLLAGLHYVIYMNVMVM